MSVFSAFIPPHPYGCSRRPINSVRAYACDAGQNSCSARVHSRFVILGTTRRSDGLPRLTSCGVLVTDGALVLLGHATLSTRWDIPKGIADPNESFRDAAVRELHEETGLRAEPEALIDCGVHRYRPGKDLALFILRMSTMPDPKTLRCESHFDRNGRAFPELDRFEAVSWEEAPARTGRDMRRLLEAMIPQVTAAFRRV